MPLTAIQIDVVRLLAGNRRPESHLAGGLAINRASVSPRYSADVDLFHDAVPNLKACAEKDAEVLVKNGIEVDWQMREANMHRAMLRRGAEVLKLEWCHDSNFRFFPVQTDAEFGYCLHRADLATNKCLALAARAEIRDFIDIVYLHETYLSLGAICWAACGKDPGFTPRSLLDFASRNMKFREEHLLREHLAQPISLTGLKESWLNAVDQANSLIGRLPLIEAGCLYLTPAYEPVTPDPASPDFAKLIRHFGSIRGAWPVLA